MSRAYNFSAGPAALPEEVLRQAQAELLEWDGARASVMEVSHRGKAFIALAEQAEQDLRELLAIPASYKVLFLQGGATQHFAQIPLNFARGASADYVLTGDWSEKAAKEARAYTQVRIAASAAATNHDRIPPRATWQLDPGAAYLHITPNETIRGVEFHDIPDAGAVPLVGDVSSTLLSRPLDVSRYALLYAGAQKNIGPSGLVVLIVREDLLERCPKDLPKILNYAEHAAQGSMLNTPNTWGWYLAGLVFKWIKAEGGVAAMAQRNRAKADLLYGYIDGSGYYRNPVEPAARSWMNVPFTLPSDELDASFLKQAEAAGLLALKGHRLVGGMRASLYNAMPLAGVQALVEFMGDFARRHG
ncbi:MAG: 3-phosphoserine/phosphohydroxythreonine transaminase [Xanthomonadales bacterium]|nr:3-phosphoserine/phosphohydroxythreonine transaminase [Xanthomonadales bacterium]MCC6596454.1 3-phosphoserine/phosphohydroxythreonine transaminase [Rhodanobacteraceae bacterium]MDL1868660.1 3-phosphoserine/phosphohydroxythreonine transaminase [Gammaproteobacteria bacterium PRO6]